MKRFFHPTKQLGKRAAQIDCRTLKLANYVKAMPPPPTSGGYIAKVGAWPMYLNDSLGDCVIAASAHMIQQWSVYAGHPALLTDQQVEKGYEAVGGYVPGDPNTDNGCDMLTALKYWRKSGFGGHRIAAFAQINHKNLTEVAQAIYLFGSVYIGLQLPLSAQDAETWSVPITGLNGDGSPGSWGGHCVPAVGYSHAAHPGLTVVTWGATLPMTWGFLSAYVDEMFAVLSTDWINKVGKAASGFAYADLLKDLGQVT